MEMNKNVPKFPTYRGSPFIETPLIEVVMYLKGLLRNIQNAHIRSYKHYATTV